MTTRARRARYGHRHRRLRAELTPLVATGTINCWRCGQRIVPDPTVRGHGWDLGHDDDTGAYRGPEHAGPCNRSSAATRGNAARAPQLKTSQPW